MLYINNEQNIRQLIQEPAVIDKYQTIIPRGKETLVPPPPIDPVSETIKKYIEEQFDKQDSVSSSR